LSFSIYSTLMNTSAHTCLGLVAAVLTTLVLTSRAEAQPEEKQTVGITVALAVELSDIERGLLEERLGEALAERFDISVVAGDAARRKLGAAPLPETCIAETPCLHRVATTLGVQRLLMLVAVRVGGDIQVDATLYETRTRVSRTLNTVRMKSEASMWKEAFTANVDGLLPDAPIRVVKPPVGPGVPGPTRPIPTYVYVVGGVGLATGALAGVWGIRALIENNKENGDSKDLELQTDIIGGAAAAIAVTAVVLYLVRPEVTSSERAVTIQTGPGDIGFAVSGSF